GRLRRPGDVWSHGVPAPGRWHGAAAVPHYYLRRHPDPDRHRQRPVRVQQRHAEPPGGGASIMSQHAKLTWHGARAKQRVRDGLVKGLGLAAEHLLTESRKVVPLEEGTLERSGVASVDEVELQAAVSYDTVYAVRQHEELDWKHAPGRTAKYL